MDRQLAEKLMQCCQDLSPPMNAAFELARSIPDPVERRTILTGWANITMCIYEQVMRPIIREHPDLDPDKDYLRRK